MEPKAPKPDIRTDYFEDLTGHIDRSVRAPVEAIGTRIRRIRESKGLSLDALAKLTGFAVDLLEAIESDQIQPQLGTVLKLSKALDAAFGRILTGAGDKPYAVTRKGAHTVVARSTSQKGGRDIYTYMSLSPEVKGRHMEPLLVQLKENPDDEMSVHEGEEFLYVLEGTVALTIGTDQYLLQPGDSAYYGSTTPHLVCSQGGSAMILAVIYQG